MIGVAITTFRESPEELAHLRKYIPFKIYHVDAEETGVRRGIGPCLMDAWQRARQDNCGMVLQMDAGRSHSTYQLIDLVYALQKGADMVIGSRFCPGAVYMDNPRRALMSRAAASLCNLKTGARYTDWTSGFRGFTGKTIDALLQIHYHTEMHTWQIEVLNQANLLGLKVVEIPIAYKAGRSSFNRRIARQAFEVWRGLPRYNHTMERGQ